MAPHLYFARRLSVRLFGLLAVLTSGVLLAACSSVQPVATEAETAQSAPSDTVASGGDPLLNATLYVQQAVEYRAVAEGAYRLAGLMMERALADSSWTASLEQAAMGTGAYRALPPAVVLDVDETVLDNSAYEARLIHNDESYGTETWNAWVRERQAKPVPGALDFTRMAAMNGVQVIYLTNRDYAVEEATRGNLVQYGFPVDHDEDVIYTQNEQPEWTGEKASRRTAIAQQYRILLLIGDNFGDFAPDVDTTSAQRRQLYNAFEQFWGQRWIVLPNPMYGSWEAALYDYEYGLPPAEKIERKRERLETGIGIDVK